MKTVIVTGANRGLGEAIKEAFSTVGWRVYGTARVPSEGSDLLALDLKSPESVAALIQKMTDANASIDLVINNAGMNPKDINIDGYFESTFAIETFDAANVAESMWVNALMPMQLISGLLPLLADDAVILNVSSWLGSIGEKTAPGHYGYAGSKALLNMLTRGLAMELKDTERAAVALNPGWMRTSMGGDNAKRTPGDTAADILKLYDSDALHQANGKFLNVDGSEHPW